MSDFQEKFHKLKIPTAPTKNFPSRKKTDGAHHACLTLFEQAQKCTCPKQQFSIVKIKDSAPSVPETIWTSSKFQSASQVKNVVMKLQTFFPAAVHWLWRGLVRHMSHFTDLDPAGRNTQAKRESWSRRSRLEISISIFLAAHTSTPDFKWKLPAKYAGTHKWTN